MKKLLMLSNLLVSSLIFSQSNYPIQTVIKGDSVVILTKQQAKNINDIFESQKERIASYKIEIAYKDSLLSIKTMTIDSFVYNEKVVETFDSLRHWLIDAAINNTWIYYSWFDSLVYGVDLSQYYVVKNDYTGDIFFYRSEHPIYPKKKKEEPPKGWETDFIKPKRPTVKVAPIKK